ncbi:methionine-gamma-lyase [Bhargavaea ginsengi]|uniref:L-methionine gamma-lyase n=1 Tax=Bhargavaea ginsengi TaxID=426757 RepID=A0A1H6UPI0_9BACL|nr:aminotransferase class I/II-fold pyridoxal phosphate-dependent enzyme [Bhargavaea ginsengi]SEI91687.1 methionine-gamma-lyase [Bhargavaea ginsengi]
MTINHRFNTTAIHAEQCPDEKSGAVSQSIIPAVAYCFDNAESAVDVVSGKKEGRYYGRYGNPTTRTLENKVAVLEGAEDALGVSSGMAAISIALMASLRTGDHVVVTKDVYGGTHKFLSNIATRYGIEYDFVDCTDYLNIENAIKENTKAVYIETPSNPTLTLIDIAEVAVITKRHDLKLIVDNTFMTPYLQRPIDLGADIVVHSATKYLNGHGDVIAGIICGSKADIDYMRKDVMGDLGQNLNAWESFLVLRGIKTLGIRMEQHCRNAQEVAEYLEQHPMVERVFYPGLPSHPQHSLAKKQMKNMGGIVAFEVKGDVQTGKDFISALKVAMISFSLGDPETLVQHPASMTHSSIPESQLHEFGLSTGLIRLSVGLEDAEDIIEDLNQALLCTVAVPMKN